MAQSGQSSAVDRSLVIVEVLVGFGVVAAIIGKAYGAATTVVFLLAGLSLAFTVYVLMRMLGALRDPSLDVTGRVEDERRAALEHEKTLILQGIKELEADHDVGKVDREDYAHLRAKAEADALRIIRALKDEDERWMRRAEALVRERVGAASAPAVASAPAADASSTPERVAAPASPPPASPPPAVAPSAATAIEALFDERPVAFDAGEAHVRCTGCETDNPPDARFCVGCGRPKAAEGAAA